MSGKMETVKGSRKRKKEKRDRKNKSDCEFSGMS